jgi:hypothetical protein
MAKSTEKSKAGGGFSEIFARVAFAEAGELYPEHPVHMRSLAEVFAEVAFAEGGEPYEEREKKEARGPVCVDGETSSGLCIGRGAPEDRKDD